MSQFFSGIFLIVVCYALSSAEEEVRDDWNMEKWMVDDGKPSTTPTSLQFINNLMKRKISLSEFLSNIPLEQSCNSLKGSCKNHRDCCDGLSCNCNIFNTCHCHVSLRAIKG
ncbi:uncharacterized protein [Watersipora subatra]|uniref:uncharacterized protein n=1 Tax=Watersipora subatra TaxID=2589382 RepID=UPI00355BB9EC